MRNCLVLLTLLIGHLACSQISDSLKIEIETSINNNLSAAFSGTVFITDGKGRPITINRGYSDIASQSEITVESSFVIGSVSKQITAAMILTEYEKGNLLLHDPIGNYLPTLSQPWSDSITIHHLLTHTHGIQAFDAPASFSAGSTFQYSQIGFELLANILEHIHNDSFRNLSHDFFETLGLTNTKHPDSNSISTKGYEQLEDGTLRFSENSFRNYVAAGSFISTAQDLVKWNTLLHSGQILHDTTFQLMCTRYATRQHPIFGEIEYGYGLTFLKEESNFQIGALGYAPGFVSSNFYFPQTNMHLVILQNVVCGLPNFAAVFEDHLQVLATIRNLQP